MSTMMYILSTSLPQEWSRKSISTENLSNMSNTSLSLDIWCVLWLLDIKCDGSREFEYFNSGTLITETAKCNWQLWFISYRDICGKSCWDIILCNSWLWPFDFPFAENPAKLWVQFISWNINIMTTTWESRSISALDSGISVHANKTY